MILIHDTENDTKNRKDHKFRSKTLNKWREENQETGILLFFIHRNKERKRLIPLIDHQRPATDD